MGHANSVLPTASRRVFGSAPFLETKVNASAKASMAEAIRKLAANLLTLASAGLFPKSKIFMLMAANNDFALALAAGSPAMK